MIATIRQHNENQIAIDTPYSSDFVSELKSTIHYTERKWAGKGTGWLVSNSFADEAMAITRRHFETVVDARDNNISETDIEDARIEAEIEAIGQNQEFILDNEDWIQEAIEALDSSIARYSMHSKSRIKARKARDRALLFHSLNNAQMPVERLTELHVKGLAAAVRLIKNSSIAKLTSR